MYFDSGKRMTAENTMRSSQQSLTMLACHLGLQWLERQKRGATAAKRNALSVIAHL